MAYTNFDKIKLDDEAKITTVDATDLASALTLLNEIKAKLNTIFNK